MRYPDRATKNHKTEIRDAIGNPDDPFVSLSLLLPALPPSHRLEEADSHTIRDTIDMGWICSHNEEPHTHTLYLSTALTRW